MKNQKSLIVLSILLFLYFLLYRWIHSTNIIEGHSSDFEQYHDNDDLTCSNGHSCHNGTCNDDTGDCDCSSDLWYGPHCDKLKSFYDFTENHTYNTDADMLWRNILTCEEKDDSYECEMEYNIGDYNIYLPPPGWDEPDPRRGAYRVDGLKGHLACYDSDKSCPERTTSATCTETATGKDSDPVDADSCAAVVQYDMTACHNVMKDSDDSVRACSYAENCNNSIPYHIDDPIMLGFSSNRGIGRNLPGTLPPQNIYGEQINSWDDVDLTGTIAQHNWRDENRCHIDSNGWDFNRGINYCNTPGEGQTSTYVSRFNRHGPSRGGVLLRRDVVDPDVGSPCPDKGECTFVKADDPSAGPNRERDRIICQKPNRDDRQRDSVVLERDRAARLPDCPRGDGIGQWHNESVGLPNDSYETYASSTNRDGMQVAEPCKCPDGTSYQTTSGTRRVGDSPGRYAGRWRCA